MFDDDNNADSDDPSDEDGAKPEAKVSVEKMPEFERLGDDLLELISGVENVVMLAAQTKALVGS